MSRTTDRCLDFARHERISGMIILGLDPGLGTTGWGVIRKEGNRLSHIDNGEIETDAKLPLANRLLLLDAKLNAVIDSFRPDAVAVEEVFVNKNPQSTLKLGQARRGRSARGRKGAGHCNRICRTAGEEIGRWHRQGG